MILERLVSALVRARARARAHANEGKGKGTPPLCLRNMQIL